MTQTHHHDPIGDRYGQRVVVAVVSFTTSGRPRLVRVRCGCGREDEVRLSWLRVQAAGQCRDCVRQSAKDMAAKWTGLVGQRFGPRVVLAYEGTDGPHHMIRVRCDCGREAVIVARDQLKRSKECLWCRGGKAKRAAGTPRDRTPRELLLAEISRATPLVWRLRCTECGPGDRCRACEARIDAATELGKLFGGLTLEEVGALLGVSRERVRQIEARGVKRLTSSPNALALWRLAEDSIAAREGGSWSTWSDAAEVATGGVI